MGNHSIATAPPSLNLNLDGEGVECVDCGHRNGKHKAMPFRVHLRRLFKLGPKLVTCGSTQWYEDDELFGCPCRNPLHSN